MKMIISCGGTGGHIIPAIAIADTVKENRPHTEILFVGSEKGMENELVQRAGYPIRTLDVRGIPRRLGADTLRALLETGRATKTARALLKEECPSIVIGTGGYACYPTLAAAAAMGIPTAVHESNAVAGLVVRALAGRVDRIWLNFGEAAAGLRVKRDKILAVGNPQRGVRRRFSPPTGAPLVLSFGGSLGARAINEAVLKLLPRLADTSGVQLLHATGKREYEEFHTRLRAMGLDGHERLQIVPFIEDMPSVMAAASVVICRAGAMSISELAYHRVPAILVPSPHVTGQHQLKNATVLARAGAARLVEESELDAHLSGVLLQLLSTPAARAEMSERIALFAHPDANRVIFEDILFLLQNAKK